MTVSILVVDDNEMNVDMMIFLLNAMGFSVLPALNGPAGLAIARAQVPDLVLCDIHMPELDGYAILAAMKSDPALSTIPIVALTSMVDAGDREFLIAKGFNGYLGKPIDVESLQEEICRHLGQRS